MRQGSCNVRCTLLNDDLTTNEPYPCRFVMVFINRRRLVKVCKDPRRDRYKAFWREGKSPWQPLRSSLLPWKPTFDAAQTELNFYAAARGWAPVWPLTAACEGEPFAFEKQEGIKP